MKSPEASGTVIAHKQQSVESWISTTAIQVLRVAENKTCCAMQQGKMQYRGRGASLR